MNMLLFANPVFNNGWNITVRRGVKWDVGEKYKIGVGEVGNRNNPLFFVDINTRVVRFCDLTDEELIVEHDPACRTKEGLLKVMKETYPGFSEFEVVTIVTFHKEK